MLVTKIKASFYLIFMKIAIKKTGLQKEKKNNELNTSNTQLIFYVTNLFQKKTKKKNTSKVYI